MTNKYFTVKEMPLSERPYEKCEKSGAAALSDAELLAVIIRSGSRNERAADVAARVLGQSAGYPGLIGLNHMNMNELQSIKGIGRVKAIQLLCIAELTKRMAKATNEGRLKMITPEAVAHYYMQDMRHLSRERVLLIMLDSKSKILKDMVISTGTVSSSLLSPREIFLNALKYEAVNVILLHNHPSGDPTPSREDIQITKRMKEAGNLIGIKLMDHIIIGDNKYVSLSEQGFI
ncbi:MAG: DNA repair protein RadC [Anaerocolumna sp.]